VTIITTSLTGPQMFNIKETTRWALSRAHASTNSKTTSEYGDLNWNQDSGPRYGP